MLTKKQVEHVALLARLELNDEEKEKYATQLNAILEYVEALNKLDTKNVPPTAHVLPLKNVFREDKVCDHMPNDQAISNGPVTEGNYFRVPKII
jgi:aspartyl-tRNA(Asn)/glutamyl-tRNA(Gln) amidotransferase subunit C